MSQERRVYECMKEIKQCRNFYELKSKLDLETKGALTKKIGDIKSQQQLNKRYTDSVSIRRRKKQIEEGMYDDNDRQSINYNMFNETGSPTTPFKSAVAPVDEQSVP